MTGFCPLIRLLIIIPFYTGHKQKLLCRLTGLSSSWTSKTSGTIPCCCLLFGPRKDIMRSICGQTCLRLPEDRCPEASKPSSGPVPNLQQTSLRSSEFSKWQLQQRKPFSFLTWPTSVVRPTPLLSLAGQQLA